MNPSSAFMGSAFLEWNSKVVSMISVGVMSPALSMGLNTEWYTNRASGFWENASSRSPKRGILYWRKSLRNSLVSEGVVG